MKILVSFCNVRTTPGRPALGLLDAASLDFRVLDLPPEVPQATGVTGLAATRRYVFAALQISGGSKALFSPPALLVFDRWSFALLKSYVFKLASDVHSLYVPDAESNELYVVSSGTDEVVELQLRGPDVVSETVRWRPDPEGPRVDVHHLNAIQGQGGELIVSGFGRRCEGEMWNSARHGFIFNITRGASLAAGVEHPHSLAVLDDGRIAYCESRRKTVRVAGDDRAWEAPGYARGLCVAGDKLFVGTSASRKVSKSTGMRNRPLDLGTAGGDCTISRLSTTDFRLEKSVSLRNFAEEIYDLLPVEGTAAWPLVTGDTFRPFDEAWAEHLQLALREIGEVVPAGKTLIVVDDNQWEVNGALTKLGRCLPFVERGGKWWGAPADGPAAVDELERMRRERDANYIVFGWPAFWWLDHYAELNTHLRSQYDCVLDNGRLIVFDLH